MKSIITSLCLLVALYINAQTTLPTSWDFVTTPATLPVGWSTNTTANYTSGLIDNNTTSSIAGKLQATDHHFTIEFFDEPGTVSYHIKSYGTASFAGTFEIQESINGTNWSTLHSFGNNDFTDSWTQFTENPNVNSRFIRFILSNKVSGTNVGLDNVSIAANVPTAQEINVQYAGNDIPNNTSIQFASPIGTSKSLKLGIQNLGSGAALNINGATISGNASADYVVSSTPSSIAPLGNDTLIISFNPSANGSRLATISISSNDANENPYLILLDGIGGTGASEPSSNPSSFSTPVLKTYRIKGAFNSVTADRYIVLFAKHNDFSAAPVDGISYEIGQGIGDAKVAYIGTNTSFYIKETSANTKYFVKVFAFNGDNSFTNYRTSDPLSTNFTTPEFTMRVANYYNTISALQNTFVSDLHNLINPHMTRYYSNYGPDMVPGLLSRDTVADNDVITCVYSGNHVVYSPPFSWPSTSMNREHTLCASWMPSYGNNNTPEYQDYHHLFPTISTPNSQRSNHPLGVVVNVTNSFGDGKVGTDINGNTVYEPRDAQKGDAARAIFYMNTAYHDPINGDAWGFDNLNSEGPNQSQEVLKNWHLQDLPSGFEHTRNDFLDSLQQNRNPFVDSAKWVCYINFRDMSYIASPDSACLAAATSNPVDTSDSTNEVIEIKFDNRWRLFPNPASDIIHVGHTEYQNLKMVIFSLNGRLLKEKDIHTVEEISISDLKTGLYFIQLIDLETGNSQTFKLNKE